jgi:hypothetical protein
MKGSTYSERDVQYVTLAETGEGHRVRLSKALSLHARGSARRDELQGHGPKKMLFVELTAALENKTVEQHLFC